MKNKSIVVIRSCGRSILNSNTHQNTLKHLLSMRLTCDWLDHFCSIQSFIIAFTHFILFSSSKHAFHYFQNRHLIQCCVVHFKTELRTTGACRITLLLHPLSYVSSSTSLNISFPKQTYSSVLLQHDFVEDVLFCSNSSMYQLLSNVIISNY